jgi:hypothetical protein
MQIQKTDIAVLFIDPQIAHLRTVNSWWVTKIRALFEATHFAGLRKAGMPEE